jgi:DNA-binding cell septation regulator SpoVG
MCLKIKRYVFISFDDTKISGQIALKQDSHGLIVSLKSRENSKGKIING